MNKWTYYFFLFTITVLLFFYEKSVMFDVADVGDLRGSSNVTSIVAFLIFLTFFAIILSKRPKRGDGISNRFFYLQLFIYFLSIIYSIIYPFGSRYLYGTILLPLLLFYFTSYTTQYANSDNVVIWAMTILFLLLSYHFLSNYQSHMLNEDFFRTNSSYSVLYLLPFLLCHKKQVLRIFAIITTFIVVMSSLKRGGTVALTLAVVVYFMIDQMALKGRRFSVFRLIFLMAILVGIYYFLIYFNSNILGESLSNRFIDDDTGSGRIDVYSTFLGKIINSSPWELLVGSGWQGSVRVGGIGLTCHNDFLEAIVDFGIIGFVLYIRFLVELVRISIRLIRLKHEYAPAMGASVAMLLVNSFVSHIFIYPNYLVLFAIFWGFIAYSIRVRDKHVYNENRTINLPCGL